MMFLRKKKVLVFLLLILSINTNAQWTNGQNASVVTGQANFTSSAFQTISTGMNQGGGVAVDLSNDKLYVADYGNHRVLRYTISTLANGVAAERVFGQADFTSGSANRGGACAQNTLNAPLGIAVDASGRLWVADADNNRIIWYNSAHSIASDGPNADGVLGQTNYTNNSSGTTASTLNTATQYPHLIVSGDGSLFIADVSNSRVLRWDDAATLTVGTNSANGVLGQTDFTSSTTGLTSSTMNLPTGVALYGSDLFVADKTNNRVLRFDDAATAANGQAANGVLGQADLTSNAIATTQSGMNHPIDVATDPAGRLYVSDIDNVRILIFDNAASLSNGANANNVIGQANFTSAVQAVTQSGLWYPFGLSVKGDHLYVNDGGAARVLQYTPSSTLPVELIHFHCKRNEDKVELIWATASEINSDYFQILKSNDGLNFMKIGEIKASGNSFTITQYNFFDHQPNNETNYYKLIQFDIDGTNQESQIITIDITQTKKNIALQIFPNPASEKITLCYSAEKDECYLIRVTALNGQVIYSTSIKAIKGENKYDLTLHELPCGQYTISLTNEHKSSYVNFVITK